ncbi:MAG TPA: hypothetical protein VGW98_07715 [Solirubrobacteraceae bacterium]|jgi:hypothetical protein|nr:hypothetical protein [Solirubrobacteraceae bacterium]
MKKKLVLSLAPLMAVAAIAVVPVAAQATPQPHWFINGVFAGATPTPAIQWGSISFVGVAGTPPGSFVTCHSAQAGTVENTAITIPGQDQIQASAAFDCEETGGFCPGVPPHTVSAIAANIPWPSKLVFAGTVIEDETTDVDLTVMCHSEPTEIKFVTNATSKCCKALSPIFRHGTSATHPGFLEYGAGSGQLEVEGSKETITVRVEGEVKVLGFAEQELISVKNS